MSLELQIRCPQLLGMQKKKFVSFTTVHFGLNFANFYHEIAVGDVIKSLLKKSKKSIEKDITAQYRSDVF